MNILQAVNAKIGSENYNRFSNGNIYPVTAMPYGMAQWCIQTDGAASPWFFNPRHRSFEGIRLTHQPSPWVGDYGAMLFLPTAGREKVSLGVHSTFRPESCAVEPYLLRAHLCRFDCDVEFVPTMRGGMFRVRGGGNAQAGFAIFSYTPSEFTVAGNTVVGYNDSTYRWGANDLREYFYISFDAEVEGCEQDVNGGLRVFLSQKEYTVRVATSFISLEQAERNYRGELAEQSFDSCLERARSAWEEKLSYIRVSDENEELYRLFYSCMYRFFLYPSAFYEYDESGAPVHWNPDIRKACGGEFFVNNGFWDTFRTVYPLLSIVDSPFLVRVLEGYINYGEEAGVLPKWLAPGNTGQMPGSLIEAVFADAASKGILRGELLERAYKLLLKNVFSAAESGRKGLEDYLRYGYYPRESYNESINNTLDSVYGDFCVAQIAEILHDDESAKILRARAKNYKLLFDPQTGFMRSKDKSGNFRKEFDAFEWGGDNCEGSYWQNSFAVYHDLEGLAALYGGKEKFLAKIDELFAAPPVFRVGGYGFEIHEMSEMAAVDFGQCAISNQPSFHFPFLYAAFGEKEKTERIVERLVNECFSWREDGFPGDEDNGTMAAWVIFACLGFYPVCPGKAEYVVSKPLFREIFVRGKRLNAPQSNVVRHENLFL